MSARKRGKILKNKIPQLTRKQSKRAKLTYLAGVLVLLDKELSYDTGMLVSELHEKIYKELKINGFNFADLPQPLTYKQ